MNAAVKGATDVAALLAADAGNLLSHIKLLNAIQNLYLDARITVA
jgi:hypothetical protein